MKFIVDSPGQLCNRFWSYLDTISWAVVNKSKVFILFWDPDIYYFDNLRNNPYISFPFYSEIRSRWIGNKWIRRLNIFNKPLAYKYLVKTWIGRKMGIVCGWRLRASCQYHTSVFPTIYKIFRPNEDVCLSVENGFKLYRRPNACIIGVHIRRGDYKTFEGGKYYFELFEYYELMKNLCSLYHDKIIYFFIASDEKIDLKLFSDLNVCDIRFQTAAHDLYALSKCDRIVGPLSTFSRWASYYGKVPLLFFHRGMKIQSDSQFSVVNDFYHFENGNEITNLTDANAI